jgi:ketosteroid isomerase-like protein
MSQSNMEAVRHAYEAFNRRDFDALLQVVDPDVEWHQFTQFPDRATYSGSEELRDRFLKQQLFEQFGDFRIDIEELVDAGDHIVMIGHIVAHGSASGVPIRLRVVNILEMRDGKVIRAYDASGPSQHLSQQ